MTFNMNLWLLTTIQDSNCPYGQNQSNTVRQSVEIVYCIIPSTLSTPTPSHLHGAPNSSICRYRSCSKMLYKPM